MQEHPVHPEVEFHESIGVLDLVLVQVQPEEGFRRGVLPEVVRILLCPREVRHQNRHASILRHQFQLRGVDGQNWADSPFRPAFRSLSLWRTTPPPGTLVGLDGDVLGEAK